jgi:mannose-1-phosphate guanylyltransferase
MFQQLEKLMSSYGSPDHPQALQRIYPTMEKISFDDAVVTKTRPDQAVVISVEFGWADLGTWEAVKEAFLKERQENLIQGKVKLLDTHDSLVYSYTDQLVAGIGLESMVVVVTKDAILVAPQHAIPKIKTVLKQFEGTDLEKYT